MSKFFTLLIAILLPFSLFSMEKEEKPIPIRECMFGSADAVEDQNADIVMKAFMKNKPIAEITHLLNSLNININSHVKKKNSIRGYKEIYTILRAALERCNPTIEEDVKCIKAILQKGALLKQQPSYRELLKYWDPYLIYAMDQATRNDDNLSIVKLLVDHGADVNFRFSDEYGFGDSALHMALEYFDLNTKCIDYLLEQDADVNAYNFMQKTPLAILASRFSQLKIVSDFKLFECAVEKLLEHGADINKKQTIYNDDTDSFFKKSNYDLLKPNMLRLDIIIKRAQVVAEVNKKKNLKIKTDKQLAANLKVAAEENKHANRSIIINGREFNLNETILGARCENLCFQLNPDYKKEALPQFSLPAKLLQNKQANRSIIINGREFKLSEAVLGARCLSLRLILNPNYKKEAHPQFNLTKPLLNAPLFTGLINVNMEAYLKKAALNLKQID